MLKYLHIENIAVIEKTEIDFSDGFNCLTGETGAGKSIVIDSINAVLGERTSKELIRNGAESAEVSALFCDISENTVKILNENGYSPDEDGNIFIRRILSNGSGSFVRINGKPATVGVLRQVASSLVNIHGQHDSQSLLNPENHLYYIDLLCDNQKERDEYYEEFKNLNAIRRELSQIETDESENARRADLLKYQINEIESASVTVGERDRLKKQLELVKNFEKTMSALNSAYYALNGSENTSGALSLIYDAQKSLSSLNSETLDNADLKLNEASSLLDDVAVTIKKLTLDTELADVDPETVRERLDTLRQIMLKYGETEEKVLLFLENAREELDKISSSKERIKELSDLLDKSTERLVSLGEKLTEKRKKTANAFEKAVTDTLLYLNMPDVSFTVKFEKGRYTRLGPDVVEFMIKTNAGDTAKPLAKIASGGELSRVMLAIKSVLADKDNVDTLIFDEIDTGVGGRAADKVGIQLKKVSNARQVICVTHLAQIAAYGEHHLLIEKSVKNDKTYTSVRSLGYEERIEELARIMSGTELTDNLYNSAKELLDRSRS